MKSLISLGDSFANKKKANKDIKMQKMPKADNNDKMLKILREIVSTGGNRKCFDCGQSSVTNCNISIGSFICTTCSGIL